MKINTNSRLTDEWNMCIGTAMDSNSDRKHRKNSEWNYNRSKKFHCRPLRRLLDRSLTIAAAHASNAFHHVQNSCLSIVNVTMDFSVVTISRPNHTE